MQEPLTFFDKLWEQHLVAKISDVNDLLAIDRLVLHDMSGSMALQTLEKSGRLPIRPQQVFTVVDHFVRTNPGRGSMDARTPEGLERMEITRASTSRLGMRLFDVGDIHQGVTHVVATEFGIALPGMTIVCGDSHTCTLGGIGALAWGIGASEGTHVLATQTLMQSKPKSMRINFNGELPPGVESKDLILYLIGLIGAQAGIGYAVEFAGPVIRAMPVEGRLTLCNMAVEFSAKYGLVAPDDLTYAYLAGREYSPKGADWDRAVAFWRTLPSDPEAHFDQEISIDCSLLKPQITWGTSPQHVFNIGDRVPDPATAVDAAARESAERALQYMELAPGADLQSIAIEGAYIGSCTNARLSDLREAAKILRGRKVADGVTAICTPGSTSVKRAAEAEGLDVIFKAAGFEWHESACGNCGAIGNQQFIGKRIVSTTNRNFENRQGRGTKTHLASPSTVAASSVLGRIAHPGQLIAGA